MKNKAIYNKHWNKWEDMKKYGPMSIQVRKLIWKKIHSLDFSTVIDVGCGVGTLLSEINGKKQNIKLSGIDISKKGLKLAKKNLPTVTLYNLDITKDYLKKEFDLTICSEVLEHLKQDQKALNNISKMTRKYLVVTTLQGRMRSFEEQVGHVRNYNQTDLLNKITKSGFTIVKVTEWGFPFYSPLYRDLFERFPQRTNTLSSGNFSLLQKFLSLLIYWLFFLNSSKRGDQLVILAKKT